LKKENAIKKAVEERGTKGKDTRSFQTPLFETTVLPSPLPSVFTYLHTSRFKIRFYYNYMQ
jgi:hypothetical protein